MRNAAGKFDDLKTALYVAARVREHLAMLKRQQHRELVHIGFEKTFKLEHDARAALRIGRGPFGEGFSRHGHRGTHFIRARQRRPRSHFARIGVGHIEKAPALAFDMGATNKMCQFLDHEFRPRARSVYDALSRRCRI